MRKNVKKNVKKKMVERILELFLSFFLILCFENNTSPSLCVFIVFVPFFIYTLLEAVIEKCLFKLSKILEKHL